ncbi:TIGR03087 family PEP-CTERM/XrtA system glycosyltransferase [Alteromonas portus]|uniref:TIGR03087 family PEP-CTERM/XrtA system glycosyltransferase n=1 Tax=Alteromonas portus TaxID=2565549 RepID=A0A4U0ZBD1_9ALTE|nr:TIGR03087 family PEP-CTERM/XrtA system glycosyltransferase [Alteromonas portus]TKB03481.1 TIGR03087 family PEP-CTERM/XrtA system glycosyltransferase [Alteromonas portus]
MDNNDVVPVFSKRRKRETSMKPPLLFLCHRMPFPPNKGDKITTFNLMNYLSKRFDLYLGSFIDDEFDKKYIDEVKAYCREVKFIDITRKRYLTSGLKSLMLAESVSTAHYRNEELQSWVHEVIDEHRIEYLFVYSSGMAQFIDFPVYKNKKRVLDMADIDSDKWRQYCENKPFYSKIIYAREYKLLKKLEQKILSEFDAITLITDEERDLFKSLSPKAFSNKIITLSNGVDTDYFDPSAQFDHTDSPLAESLSICFTGAMDYWANEDAVVWFCEKVWPLIIEEHPALIFYIVGGKPTERVKKLASIKGVFVTGRVVDVRPYIDKALVAVATLRIARGVQNKVLEAMSMAKPVVMTSMAQEGIALPTEQKRLVIDDEAIMAQTILNLVSDNARSTAIGEENRKWIVDRYSWEGALKPLDKLYPRKDRNDSTS